MPRAYRVIVSDSVDTPASSPRPREAINLNLLDSSTRSSHAIFSNPEHHEQEQADGSQARISNGSKDSNGTLSSVDNFEEVQDGSSVSSWCFFIFSWRTLLKAKLQPYRQVLTQCVRVVLVLLYLAYSGYALYRQWGTESATRLCLVLAIVLWLNGGGHIFRLIVNRLGQVHVHPITSGRIRRLCRWFLYLAAVAGAVVYLALEVAPHQPRNLISLGGVAVLLLIGLLLSTHPERVNWHAVFWGLCLQFYLALFLLRTRTGSELFEWLGQRLKQFISYTDQGSRFLFGKAYRQHPFVFKSMPVVVFSNSVIASGYYFGAVQAIIASFGRFLAWCLGTTPIESVNAAANIFLGIAEAPLLVKPFLEHVTESELFAIMTGGFASIAGAITATIIDLGVPANHVLAASVMSAPAALAVAKLMCPEVSSQSTMSAENIYKIDIPGMPKNLLEAISKGSKDGVTIIVTVCANLLVFIALLAFADSTVEWFGDQLGLVDFSLSRLLAYLFYPLMYVCGVDTEDLMTMGRLFGMKTLSSTILGYSEAGILIANSRTLNNYITLTNGTWHRDGFDVVLDAWNQTLVGGVFTERSIVMSTYILCGISNLSSCGICIGTMSALAPGRMHDIIKHVVWACVAGNIACFLTGCVAGLLYV